MAKKDINGRTYAYLKNVKEGDVIETDGGFTCGMNNKRLTVMHDGRRSSKQGLYVECNCGRHYIGGQANYAGGPLIGIYPMEHANA